MEMEAESGLEQETGGMPAGTCDLRDNTAQNRDVEAFKDLIVQLRGINQRLKKQCKAPMGEVVSLIVIQHLCRRECQISMSAIGEKMHLSCPAVSRMIHNLKRKGYIELHHSSKDHRVIFIALTKEGESLINEEMARCMSLIQGASEKMGQEDMEYFLYYSNRFFSLLS